MSLARLSFRAAAFARISFTMVDLPDPETPVTQVKRPTGNWASTFCRLCWLAPLISSHFFCGKSVLTDFVSVCRPERYSPVSKPSFFCPAQSSGVPSKRTSPPESPAPGPSSIRWSAARIVSSSCSTTTTELPRSRNSFSDSISFWLSFGCNPMLGSSST